MAMKSMSETLGKVKRMEMTAIRVIVSISLLYLSTGLSAQDSSPYEPDEQTLRLWHFDEGEGIETKEVVQGKKAELVGGCEWTEGKFGKAIKLNGTDGHIVMQQEKGWLAFKANESFTVDVWVKVFKQGGTQQILASKPIYEMEVRGGENGVVSFNLKSPDTGVTLRCTGGTDIADDEWHHIATVRDAEKGKLILYVDGLVDAELKDETAGEVGIYESVVIGSGGEQYEMLGGVVDELRISKGVREFKPTGNP